jgi:hypothetical protein
MTDVKYHHMSVCSDRTDLFTNLKLQIDGDVRTMFSIFSQYMTKGPIELDTKLVRSVRGPSTKLWLAWLNPERTKLKHMIYLVLSFVCVKFMVLIYDICFQCNMLSFLSNISLSVQSTFLKLRYVVSST